MKIPTLHQQMFGNINKKLNAVRRHMNDDVKELVEEHKSKKQVLL